MTEFTTFSGEKGALVLHRYDDDDGLQIMLMMRKAFKYVHDEVDDAVFSLTHPKNGEVRLCAFMRRCNLLLFVRHAGRQNARDYGCKLVCTFRTYT